MTPSEEILRSIEQRLGQLNEEIAALESARARLSADAETDAALRSRPAGKAPERRARKPAGRRGKPAGRRAQTGGPVRKPARPAAGKDSNGAGELTEEEWVARRATELAAQSRRPAAA